MFKEILQIVPQLSSSDLGKMESSLSKRFTGIAKKFGKGLLAAITGGGVLGAALGIVDKLLNPLQAIQEAIDKTLAHGQDLSTQAKQFNSTSGELAKLQAFGKAKGIDPEALNVLITKFQGAVSEAVADPTKNTSVRQFTGEKDTVKGFFNFIQGLQALDKVDKNKAIQVQQEVFGEKQILRMSEFLNSDFNKLNKDFAGINTDRLTKNIDHVAKLGEKADTISAVQGLKDLNTKSGKITDEMITSKAAQEQRKLDEENKQLTQKNYENLVAINEASAVLMETAKEGVLKLTGALVQLTDLTNNVKKLINSSWLRRLGFGKEDK